ncbi:LysM peptidoglycan-binding domain-containing protein [Metabacillus arenae]|uniref:LysM peptidoglycan-binding domain-containing protein n=1 Tax=Metabacillus arenae TaxID=2771434 RepID=A0A926NKX2_9BACI|nr:LysM peptidoglycan-binding domain-containing protein [Metabacillus arenae]MBD1382498.1 LysM peptidoglycan-binding domain-containing protein [Metabacillus arenae]
MQFFYTVRSGDTLYQIAKRWELPVRSLIAANNLQSPYTIFVGQQLSIPPGVNKYRVQAGDSVFRISQLFGVPVSVIVDANKLQIPYVIQVGQLLEVPPGVPYYIVQPGDTLFQIARRYNVITDGNANHELIRQVNRLPSADLFPGMKLMIPYAPPGDHGLIAYTSDQSGHYDIWLYNPRNGVTVQLTNELGESFSDPEWSPDSTRIAFIGENRILYVIHVPTGSITRIDQLEEEPEFRLDWSPGSTWLAYVKRDHIVLYNVLTHESQSINQPDASDVNWFPNSLELLFQAPDASGISQLFRIRTDGTGKQQITSNTEGPLHNVHLSSDGTFALYTTPGVSISIIHTVELATGNIFEVKGGPLAKNYYPEWSPDSLRIAYSATAYEERGYFSQIRTVRRRGENDRVWAISDCFATPVTWSPDGRKIAYLSGCEEQEFADEMWVIDLNHPVPIRLIEGVTIMALQWSPSPIIELPRKRYTNLVYKVNFQYPAYWQRVNNERYEGVDGFFQISAISADENIQEVCQAEAFHQLMPYGSMPRIVNTQIQNQEACFIFPSADQPAEMRKQAALIARYPKPVEILETVYNYFILWADQPHINEIALTLNFME